MKSVLLALVLAGCAVPEPPRYHWERQGEYVAVFDRDGLQVSPWILRTLLGEEGRRIP